MKYGIEDVHVMPSSICEFHENRLCKSHTPPFETCELICIDYPPHLLSSLVEIRFKICSHDVGHLFRGNQHREEHILTFLGTLCLGGGGGPCCCVINERLIQVLQYKKDWNLTEICVCLLLTLKSQLITGNLENSGKKSKCQRVNGEYKVLADYPIVR